MGRKWGVRGGLLPRMIFSNRIAGVILSLYPLLDWDTIG